MESAEEEGEEGEDERDRGLEEGMARGAVEPMMRFAFFACPFDVGIRSIPVKGD